MDAQSAPILVIDDDPDFCEYVEIILRAEGYSVVTASSAEQGRARMEECCPRLVIADVMMSYVLDGWSIGREVKADPRWSHVPVIMVSAIVSHPDDPLFPAIPEGTFDAFLSKPLNPDTLMETVRALAPQG